MEGSLSFKEKERREPVVYTAGFLSCRVGHGTNHVLKIVVGRARLLRVPSISRERLQNIVLWFSFKTLFYGSHR